MRAIPVVNVSPLLVSNEGFKKELLLNGGNLAKETVKIENGFASFEIHTNQEEFDFAKLTTEWDLVASESLRA